MTEHDLKSAINLLLSFGIYQRKHLINLLENYSFIFHSNGFLKGELASKHESKIYRFDDIFKVLVKY